MDDHWQLRGNARVIYAMPVPAQLRPCEKCHSLARVVTSNDEDATELTIRCKACGHVWVVPRSDGLTPAKTKETRRTTSEA